MTRDHVEMRLAKDHAPLWGLQMPDLCLSTRLLRECYMTIEDHANVSMKSMPARVAHCKWPAKRITSTHSMHGRPRLPCIFLKVPDSQNILGPR